MGARRQHYSSSFSSSVMGYTARPHNPTLATGPLFSRQGNGVERVMRVVHTGVCPHPPGWSSHALLCLVRGSYIICHGHMQPLQGRLKPLSQKHMYWSMRNRTEHWINARPKTPKAGCNVRPLIMTCSLLHEHAREHMSWDMICKIWLFTSFSSLVPSFCPHHSPALRKGPAQSCLIFHMTGGG